MSRTLPKKPKQSVPFLNLPLQHRPLKTKLLAAISRVVDSAHFILGPETQALEKEIAKLCQAQFAYGVNSGTDALILALRALDIGPGDEVILPDFTFVATATSVLLTGATPVLADIEPQSFNIDPEQVRKKITRRTRAIIPVHLYGQPANMNELLKLAKKHHLAVIEDAAQAIGATWQNRPVGALGDIGCLSFFPTKNFGALGDAGMVLTNSPVLAKRLNRLRQHGAERKYFHDEVGLNSRLDEIQAAALRVKLPYLEGWNQRRCWVAGQYQQGLKNLPIQLPLADACTGHVYHQYAIRTPQRAALQEFLSQQGIGTAIHYPLPVHQQPLLASSVAAKQSYPNSTRAAAEVLCLPIAPELSAVEVRRVIRAVQEFWKQGA